jgi:ureidoacrylate peracid hydrolase
MNRALLVVDMQNGFCHPEGSFTRIGMGLEGADDAVRNAAIAIKQARRAAIPVVFTRHLYRPGRADEGQALRQNSPALAGLDGLQGGTWDAEVVAELGCGPQDLTVDKVRFDAFQWTSLEPLLRGLGVDDLVVCGVVTNLCVETTIRSAFMRDFPVTLLADCCAAQTRRLHDLSLEVLSSYRLARIESITAGFDLAEAEADAPAVPVTATIPASRAVRTDHRLTLRLDDDLQAGATRRVPERLFHLAQPLPPAHQRAEVHHPARGQADRPRVHVVHPPHHRDRQPLAPRHRGLEPDRVVARDAGQHHPPAGPDRLQRQPDRLAGGGPRARRLERHVHAGTSQVHGARRGHQVRAVP